ncbi:MAG: YigZ family protein [Pseudomonadota bacterium]
MRCLVPASPVDTALDIKRSRFLTHVAHAASAREAVACIALQRENHPTADHVCWAFIAGAPGHTTAVGCSDDGEPSGTAGKPMLNVLQHGEVGFVVATTARYFGGTKLGTGGLVRAYTQAVVAALAALETRPWRPQTAVRVTGPYAAESALRRVLAAHEAPVEDTRYADGVELLSSVPSDQLDALRHAVRDASQGQAEVSTR